MIYNKSSKSRQKRNLRICRPWVASCVLIGVIMVQCTIIYARRRNVQVNQQTAATTKANNHSGPLNNNNNNNNNKALLLPPLATREDIGPYIEEEGLKTGMEIGVQRGYSAKRLLLDWKSCERFYLVDLWKQQENYADSANVGNEDQQQIFLEAQERLRPWVNKTIFLPMPSAAAAPKIRDEELDFIYIDARHDFCGVKEDMELYWPKLKKGGIMAGHDYVTAPEAATISEGLENWSICEDGTKHEGAVKGAVTAFAQAHQLQVLVTYRELYPTWMIRKPRV
jgi:predicted O-methyltransferase YrrM